MSKKCSFIKTPDDLKAINKGLSKITTHGTETLNLFWNTDIKILEKYYHHNLNQLLQW